MHHQPVGSIAWIDLTVEAAESARTFYEDVIGWRSEPVEMGAYDDYNMMPPGGGAPVAGVCHARGSSADLPARWLPYFVVEDLERSMSACTDRGGRVVVEPRGISGGRYCVIEDPAGACCAMYQPT